MLNQRVAAQRRAPVVAHHGQHAHCHLLPEHRVFEAVRQGREIGQTRQRRQAHVGIGVFGEQPRNGCLIVWG